MAAAVAAGSGVRGGGREGGGEGRAGRQRKELVPAVVTAGQLPPDPSAWRDGAVVLVDKPKGWTSFDVCNKLRKALAVRKVGHAGTLDPMATGLLVVCCGRATKLADRFQAMDKVYTGVLRLGEGTPSYDADEPVSEELPWEHISDGDLERGARALEGAIMQAPPMYSAISVGGERLYAKARRGETVEVRKRPVTIHSFSAHRMEPGGRDVRFRVACSKGTYVRSLAHDLGRSLGSVAHLTALRRERNGQLDAADAWGLEDLVDAYHKDRIARREAREAAEAAGAAGTSRSAPRGPPAGRGGGGSSAGSGGARAGEGGDEGSRSGT